MPRTPSTAIWSSQPKMTASEEGQAKALRGSRSPLPGRVQGVWGAWVPPDPKEDLPGPSFYSQPSTPGKAHPQCTSGLVGLARMLATVSSWPAKQCTCTLVRMSHTLHTLSRPPAAQPDSHLDQSFWSHLPEDATGHRLHPLAVHVGWPTGRTASGFQTMCQKLGRVPLTTPLPEHHQQEAWCRPVVAGGAAGCHS